LATGLLYYEIDDPQSLTLSDLVKESPEVSDRAQREAYCSYGLLGFHSGGSIATSALNELREKAWSGIRLPSRRRNRYNEHVADDLREV